MPSYIVKISADYDDDDSGTSATEHDADDAGMAAQYAHSLFAASEFDEGRSKPKRMTFEISRQDPGTAAS